MADLSQPNNPLHPNSAEDHLSRLLVDSVEEPWYKLFAQNIRELFNPPKLPPLEVTSKPVAVKDIWGLYGRKKKSFMMSTGFQVLVVAILFGAFATKQGQKAIRSAVSIVLPPSDVPDVYKRQVPGPCGPRQPRLARDSSSFSPHFRLWNCHF